MTKVLLLCSKCLDLFRWGGFKTAQFGKEEKGQCENCGDKNVFIQRVRIDGKGEADKQRDSSIPPTELSEVP